MIRDNSTRLEDMKAMHTEEEICFLHFQHDTILESDRWLLYETRCCVVSGHELCECVVINILGMCIYPPSKENILWTTTGTHEQVNNQSYSSLVVNLEVTPAASVDNVNAAAASVRCAINSHGYMEGELEGGYLDACCWFRYSAGNGV